MNILHSIIFATTKIALYCMGMFSFWVIIRTASFWPIRQVYLKPVKTQLLQHGLILDLMLFDFCFVLIVVLRPGKQFSVMLRRSHLFLGITSTFGE